jgi:hypothetical protein
MIDKNTFLNKFKDIHFLNEISMHKTVQVPKAINECNKISWHLTEFDSISELSLLQTISGMSTAANAKIINLICKSLAPNEIYLNIGVYHGYSLIAGLINTSCIVEGVDNFSQFSNPKDIFFSNYNKFKRHNSFFYDDDYKNFLQNKKSAVDFYFYDGPHKYQDQYNAINLAKHLFKSNTIIMIDDTNLSEVEQGTFDALKDNNINYDVWVNIKTAHNKHPTFWNGVIVLQLK